MVATDLASRGIHVQDIAHVINYDLPEMAESFIHRVGRTGRAGGRGVASTLFARNQQLELRQLERTLGIRIERMQTSAGLEENHDLRQDGNGRVESKMVRLPEEILQVQMEESA